MLSQFHRLPPSLTSLIFHQSQRGYATTSSTAWETIIGLEIHLQIKSPVKLFSRTKTSYEHPPNTEVSLFDAAIPGTLPKLSPEPVRAAILASLALNCDIQPRSTFDRKHYFHHDQPAGYQITQHYNPISKDGYIQLPAPCSNTRVRIEQIQLEQDTAKSLSATDLTLIDFNRVGTPLLEIVSAPDMRTAEEAGLYIRMLQAIFRRLGISDANMDKGEMRIDCNVSTNIVGAGWGQRVEIKNLNSVRYLQGAIAYEVKRHRDILEAGGQIQQETRHYDEDIGETVLLRVKEGEADYRYMPDPNLPALHISSETIQLLSSGLRELPLEATTRLSQKPYDLTSSLSAKLVGLDPLQLTAVSYFESIVSYNRRNRDSQAVANFILNEMMEAYKKVNGPNVDWRSEEASMVDKISDEEVSEILDLISESALARASAKALLMALLKADAPQPGSPSRVSTVVSELSLLNLSPSETINICQSVIEKSPKEVEMYKSGNVKVVKKLLGAVVKQSGGKVDVQVVEKELKALLGK